MFLGEKSQFLKEPSLKLRMILIGGSIIMMGTIQKSHGINSSRFKDIVPIDVQLNIDKIEFYRDVLIPEIYKIFANKYNEQRYLEVGELD